jgi:MFS family permease
MASDPPDDAPSPTLASPPTPEALGRFAAMRAPAFRLLMAAGMAMQLGQWIQRVALLYVVYEITGSAVALGALGFLTSIFVIVLSPIAGVVADRFGARRVLLFAAVGQAVAAALLAVGVFTDHAGMPLLYAVGATFGIGQALNQPTRNLLVYDSVGRDRLRNGLALNAMTGGTMRIIGPTVGGLVIAAAGAGAAFALQAVLLVASVVFVWLLPVESRRTGVGAGVLTELIGGARHLGANPALRRSVLVAAITSALVYPYLNFIPVFASENLDGGASAQGILLSAGGVGSMVGLWYVMAGRGGMRSMLWASAIYMALVTTFTQSTHFWLAFALLVGAGVVHSVYMTLNQALVQLNAPEEYRARVMGIYSMMSGFEPFSVLALGPLIEAFGVSRATGSASGLAMLITLALAIGATLSERRRAGAAPVRE